MRNLFYPIGGGNEIGASCYFVELNGDKLLLDSGIRLHSDSNYPRFASLYAENLLDGLWELDTILLSHGHLDHVGSLPTVVEEAPEVPIYATLPTRDIMELQLNQPLQTDEAFMDFREVKLFNQERVQRAIDKVQPKEWYKPIPLNNCLVSFFPAGHILGASMVYIASEAGNVLFTGDFTHFDQKTVARYQLPDNLEVDLLITESTYGYQEAAYAENVDTEREIFAHKIEKCLEKGGSVLIPAFAIGRSQELALILQELVQEERLKPFPIRIDGLAQVACEIYEANGVKVFGRDVEKAQAGLADVMDVFNGVIIASSGMLLDNSASARYAEKLLPDPRNSVFFSGYLDEESPGKRLAYLYQNRGERFHLNKKTVPVHADVDTYRLSAHTDSSGILALIEKVNPKKVVFVHGYPQYGTEINVYSQTSRQFHGRIEVYQANNGTPIYF